MDDLLSPAVENPNLVDPVHPEIEAYLLGLVKQTDHPVLLQMESYAWQHEFPIANRLVGRVLGAQVRM